ncbi:MAG: beta-eliminating lyase-related protein [Gammaproteobacteria bacterium]
METAKAQSMGTDRDLHLEEFGYNTNNIHPSLIEYDLMTDSWTELLSPQMSDRMLSLQDQVDFTDRKMHVADLFPFKKFIYTSQGRSAEAFFWRAAGKKDKKVIQNLLFPTSRVHVAMSRMMSVEMPVDHVFELQSHDLFRGNLDCGKLRDYLRDEGAESVAYIYIEAENNASGGYPVSMSNIREISSIISEFDISMVLDSTRLIENAVLIQRYESGYENASIRDIIQEFCSYFDSMTCSLAKDFGITRGGLIATNDERLFYRAQDAVATYGPGINSTDKAIINAAIKGWPFIEKAVVSRVNQVESFHAALTSKELSIATPAPGHCILLDVADYLDISAYTNPVVAFVNWIYLQTGIRAGLHVSGMSKPYSQPTFVRFAIPLCTPDENIEVLAVQLAELLQDTTAVPDMKRTLTNPGVTGMMRAHYSPLAVPSGC